MTRKYTALTVSAALGIPVADVEKAIIEGALRCTVETVPDGDGNMVECKAVTEDAVLAWLSGR